MLVPCGRPGRSLKVFTLKYGLLMNLFNKRQKAGERKLRHNLETFLPYRKTVSGWLERLSVRQRLLLSQKQLLLPRTVTRLELRLLE